MSEPHYAKDAVKSDELKAVDEFDFVLLVLVDGPQVLIECNRLKPLLLQVEIVRDEVIKRQHEAAIVRISTSFPDRIRSASTVAFRCIETRSCRIAYADAE